MQNQTENQAYQLLNARNLDGITEVSWLRQGTGKSGIKSICLQNCVSPSATRVKSFSMGNLEFLALFLKFFNVEKCVL